MESKVRDVLKKHFKFDTFKSELQEAAILEISKRSNDVLVSMPTGSGKSLCYQLPALLYPGKVTLVFSPLLALIKDQIDHLISLKIKASSLNSKTLTAERNAILTDLKTFAPTTQLLYITPEQAATRTFKELFSNMNKNDKIAFIIVDEAHCVSEWGHDFRPDYLKLGELRNDCIAPCVALTATAGSEVIKDIVWSLKLSSTYQTFKTSCFRNNLFYDVYYQNCLDNPYQHLKQFILGCLNTQDDDLPKENRPCGIVYCRTREQTEMLAHNLTQIGVKSVCYHAGLKSKERLESQDSWQNGDYPVICATVSFGMGVDKASVRFVVHWGVPKDPASFYQESGRAGRDGKASKCRVYYNRADRKAVEFHLSHDLAKAKDKESRKMKAQNAIKGFTKIIEFCETAKNCRHQLFSSHFGESPPDCRNRCDICRNRKEVEERAHNFLMRCIQFSDSSTNVDVDFSDLYEGGRKGIAQESIEYSNCEENSNSSEQERKAKKESTDLIKKQFLMRKNSQEVSQEAIDKLLMERSRVLAPSSSSSKVSGLSLATREQYLTKIAEVLSDNYTKCSAKEIFDKKDMEACAVDLEYSIFTSTSTIIMYRSSNAKLITNIKKSTSSDELYEALATFTPRPARNETLSDLFRNIKKEQKLEKQTDNKKSPLEENFASADSKKRQRATFEGFQTANELLDANKRKKLDKNQTTLSSFFKKETKDEAGKPSNGLKVEKSVEKNIEILFGDGIDNSPLTFESPVRNDGNNETSISQSNNSNDKPTNDFHSFKIKTDSLSQETTIEKSNINKEYKRHHNLKEKEKHKNDHKHAKTKESTKQNFKEISNKIKIDETKFIDFEVKQPKRLETESSGSKLKKTEIGLLVVKLLTPAYVARRFESRDAFKSTARNISHALINKDELEIKLFVKRFLKNNEKITSTTTL